MLELEKKQRRRRVQGEMQNAGLRGMELMWITGKMVLLCFSSAEARGVMLENDDLLQWFSSVVPWSPEVGYETRRAWLSIRGLPIHVWSDKTFKILRGYGERLFIWIRPLRNRCLLNDQECWWREGGMLNVSDSANSPSVVPSDGRTKTQVVVGDSGSEAEGQDSPRWHENKLWIAEGGSSVHESLEQGGVTKGDDVVGGFYGPLDNGESPAEFDLEQNYGNRQVVENIGWDSIVQNPDCVKIGGGSALQGSKGSGRVA
ncbi:hypothetical protein V6N12_011311 [Hibiscus sabdariffa]|uniref:DUF4283 domain-containing protein n=1 Tax=Hibiscus sabdariffa TaxID=183260 RepID=A0ABR2B9L6_9ROSI